MSVTRNVLWKRQSALGTILFCVYGGFGGEEPLFPKAPKPFSETASPRISATLIEHAPKRVNSILSDYKNDAPHGTCIAESFYKKATKETRVSGNGLILRSP